MRQLGWPSGLRGRVRRGANGYFLNDDDLMSHKKVSRRTPLRSTLSRTRGDGLPVRRALFIQQLETRRLLAGDILGSVFNDDDGSGDRNGAEVGSANVRVYIDLNLNGKFDDGPASEPFALTNSDGDFAIANDLSEGDRVSVRVDFDAAAVTSPALRSANVGSVEMQNDSFFPLDSPQPTNVQDIESADFDGDGVTDVAFFQGGAFEDLKIMLGDSATGEFGARTETLSSADSGAQLASGDFNGDGKSELVIFEPNTIASNQDSVNLFGMTDSTSSFSLLKRLQVANPTEVLFADVDTTTDGLELLVLSGSAAELAVFRSVSDTYDTSVTIDTTGGFAAAMTTGDFNGDGSLDVAVSDSTNQAVIVMIGNGEGGFTIGDSIFGFNDAPQVLASGLLEGDDTDTDLAVINGTQVSILKGDGQGGFTNARDLTADFNNNAAPSRLVTGDMDGDGDSELVFSSINDGRFALLDVFENRAGVLTPDFATQFGVAFDFAHPVPVAIGKFAGAPAHSFAVAAHYQQAEESFDAFPFPEALQIFGAGRQHRVTLQSSDVNLPVDSFGVIPPPSTSIVLTGENEIFSMSQPSQPLDGITLIDIRGTGDNQLDLDASVIRANAPDSTMIVIADAGDTIVFDFGWQYVSATLVDGNLVRRFQNSGAQVDLIGPRDFTNPLELEDVNGIGGVTAGDALLIINELARRRFSDAESEAIRNITAIGTDGFQFFDVSEDLRISALDALRVINRLARNTVPLSQFIASSISTVPTNGFADDEPQRWIEVGEPLSASWVIQSDSAKGLHVDTTPSELPSRSPSIRQDTEDSTLSSPFDASLVDAALELRA